MISLCLTNYNRTHLLLESFKEVYDNPLINEIVIVDDCSDGHIWDYLRDSTKGFDKVRLHRNQENLGMSRNKKRSVELATNEWCIVFDSDNVLNNEYVYCFDRLALKDAMTTFCPSFARPQFDFSAFAGLSVTKENVKAIINQPMGEPLLNCCNYVVNKTAYLHNHRYYPEVKGTDTIHFAYDWLVNGGSFYIVPGMEYMHRVHEGSGFLEHCQYNMLDAQLMKEKIMNL